MRNDGTLIRKVANIGYNEARSYCQSSVASTVEMGIKFECRWHYNLSGASVGESV